MTEMRVRALKEGEEEECLQLWLTVFGDGREYFERYFSADPNYRREFVCCAEEDGRLVSIVQIVNREVACGNSRLVMGGIANVATLPEYRRRQLSTECLRLAVRVMEVEDMDFSLLFTGHEEAYTNLYGGVGWERVKKTTLAGEIRSDLPSPPSDLTVRPYDRRDDRAVRSLYAAFNGKRPGSVIRTETQWNSWIGWSNGKAPGEARIAERDGMPVGYVLFDARNDNATVKEVAGDDEAVNALLLAVVRECAIRSISALHFILPSTPAICAAVHTACIHVVERLHVGGMVRFLHRGDTIGRLLPDLEANWNSADSPPGEVVWTGPCGSSRLLSDGSSLTVEPCDSHADCLTQSEFFALFASGIEPANRLDQRNLAFAKAVFPPRQAWFWPLDGF